MADLTAMTAIDLAGALRRRELSAIELMTACYDRIEAYNPSLNAIVNLLPRTDALALAQAADHKAAAGAPLGALHGLPMAPKDNVDVAGFPTTSGFRPFAGRIARHDALVSARQRAAGALFIGKTNMPEFGLGSHTFNSLFGATRNPWDPGRSAGGSSGGAAVALATGMVPLADGSDMGGSLRNPASFCNVVGFRPTIGLIPDPRGLGWLARLTTAGPMARNVADAAYLLAVQAGAHPDDPLSLSGSTEPFSALIPRRLEGLKIAWWAGGPGLPVDPAVARVVADAAGTFESLGCSVQEEAPPLTGAMDVFRVLRAAALSVTGRALDIEVPGWRDHAKATAVWNLDQWRELGGADIVNAEVRRTALHRAAARFFDRYDALVLPAAQVPPFPIEQEWVTEINGVALPNYLDWMQVCCIISVLGGPAAAVPAGFTPDGLPVGIQIVGRARDDLGVLGIAAAFEVATGHGRRAPPESPGGAA
ncbi:MAG: amidase [Pseudomonadales bacterium]|nr:amidase [Pseudomonadales bacterium]